jgi:hypothetical protein
VGLRDSRVLRLAMLCLVVVAAIVLTTTLALQAQRTRGETARKEGAVKRALPVIQAAIEAALAKDAAASARAQLQRAEPSGPDAYRQFITEVRSAMLRRQQLGQDFTWRGRSYRWPTNPFTGHPMAEGTGPGDFAVRFTWYGYVSGQPDAFELIGFGHDGTPVVTLRHSQASTPALP